MVYLLIALVALLVIALGAAIYIAVGFAEGGRWKV